MEMKFTPEQQRVIDTRDSSILVSAAAGSGKTAVLVERIVQMITGESGKSVDIDRLLIVTFTQAAAAEMRERISAAIEGRLARQPESAHLQKQAALLHNAQITTIDSFCLFVLRNNFNDIGLDPGFRVADEGEIRLLKQDVLAQLLEDYFEREDAEFYRLLESFSPSGSEKPLAEQILKVYEYAMSFPWPEEWLQDCARERYETVAQMEESGWMKAVFQDCRNLLEDMLGLLDRAEAVCESPDGPYMYLPAIESDRECIQMLLDCLIRERPEEKDAEGADGKAADQTGSKAREEAGDGNAAEAAGKETADVQNAGRQSGILQAVYDALRRMTFVRLAVKKDESVSVQKREQVKSIRSRVKDAAADLKERFFYREPQEMLQSLQQSQENIRKLAELALSFAEAFDAAKREKNIIDFQDMEHMALRILVHREQGEDRPSEAALQYRDYFEEILIDEYQDSNLVQEALLKSVCREDAGQYNRFMVGDVKQSIYKFRLARPELFLEKYGSYSRTGGPRIRIDLHRNFRSRTEVLDSVNLLFGKIMGRRLGNVEYDEEAALYPGAPYAAPQEEDACRTELLLYEYGTKEEETEEESGRTDSRKEAEARMTAKRILELHGTFRVTDKSGVTRPAAWRDMVILLRSNQGWDDVFLRVLKEEGVPVYAAGKTGYFSTSEIQTLLHFLRVIDNPLQDIPLYGVLRSVLGGFHERELALIKAQAADRTQKRYLYQQLCAYRGETQIEEKAARFQERLARYRGMACYTPVAKLLQIILQETGYLYEAAAMPGGEQRQANVEMLLSRASDFEQTSYYGLFHFIRYIEQMEKYEIDYGEANIMDENSDSVRIMSIHKSKGLEFPICFVCGLSKRFNRMDTNRAMLTDVDYGMAAECVDTGLRLSQTTLKKNALGRKLLLDAQGEELRVLYVAMTRAREKLILTGTVDDMEKKKQEAELWRQDRGRKLPFLLLAGAGCYLDWILPAVLGEEEIRMSVMSGADLRGKAFTEAAGKEYLKMRLRAGLAAGTDETLSERLAGRFSFVYPHGNLEGLYTKTTVSELKKAGTEEEPEAAALYPQEEIVPYIPRFMEEKEQISGSVRGSAYHRVMELLRFADMPAEYGQQEAWLREQMRAEERSGRLSRSSIGCINTVKAAAFLRTGLAARMSEADRKGLLYREQPFVLGIRADRLKPQFPAEETVLVQGIIDVYFEEEDYLVVADYKTDRVTRPQELTRRYQVQLEYYAEALERLTGRPVREKIIYSFALGREIRIE